jgi:hypothetical protein
MTAEDRARYGRVSTMCEFMTNVASAMQFSGGLSDVLRGRVEESIKPVCEARDWMWDIGQLMILSRPLPAGFHEALEITENRALDALPLIRAAMDAAFDEFAEAARESEGLRRSNVVAFKAN